MPESLENILRAAGYAFGVVLSGLGLKHAFDFINKWRKTSSDVAHTSVSSNISTLQLSDSLLRDWMKSANDAATELLIAKRQIVTAEGCLRDMLRTLKDAEVTGWEAFEERINGILNSK